MIPALVTPESVAMYPQIASKGKIDANSYTILSDASGNNIEKAFDSQVDDDYYSSTG